MAEIKCMVTMTNAAVDPEHLVVNIDKYKLDLIEEAKKFMSKYGGDIAHVQIPVEIQLTYENEEDLFFDKIELGYLKVYDSGAVYVYGKSKWDTSVSYEGIVNIGEVISKIKLGAFIDNID